MAKQSDDYCRSSSGIQMVDTAFTVTENFLESMRAVGVDTIARYYDYENETLPGKLLTLDEADLITEHGLNLLVVFQHRNNRPETFRDWRNRGPSDAQRSLDLAARFNQPEGSAIYFGVDGDFVGSIPGYTFYTDDVVSYFEEINRILGDAGHPYRIGAYGSGECLRTLLDRGLISFRWLSHSHGFVGSRDALTNGAYDIEQYLPGTCGGRSIDFNARREANLDVGQFSLT